MLEEILIKYGVSPLDTEDCLREIMYYIKLDMPSVETKDDQSFISRFLGFDNEWNNFSEDVDFLYLGMAALCVVCAALAAGLTMGFMSQDAIEIEIKAQCGSDAEKKQAKKCRK